MAGPQRHRGRGVMLLLLAIAIIAAAGCASGGAGAGGLERQAAPEDHRSVDPTPTTGITGLKCGQPFRSPPGPGLLVLSGRFPAAARAGERTISGTVEVTSRQAVRGVVATHAEVFLVRDGLVVTVPVPQDAIGVRWDLAPGRAERMPGEATLVSCEPGGGSVRPGMYQLYARVVVTPDDGAGVESFGGPWPLEVR